MLPNKNRFQCIQCREFFQPDHRHNEHPLCLVCAKHAGLIQIVSSQPTKKQTPNTSQFASSQSVKVECQQASEKELRNSNVKQKPSLLTGRYLLAGVALLSAVVLIGYGLQQKDGGNPESYDEEVVNFSLTESESPAPSPPILATTQEAAFLAMNLGDLCQADRISQKLAGGGDPIAKAIVADRVFWQTFCGDKDTLSTKGSSAAELASMALKTGLKEKVERGNAQAQYAIYRLLYNNLLPKESGLQGPEYYLRKAAQAGLAQAQYEYGQYYHEPGHDANQWYQKAAEQGHRTAQYLLGCSYYEKGEDAADFQEAAKWFWKAAEQGLAAAQYNIGVLYSSGAGVKQDFRTAVTWFTKAAEQGHDAAQKNLDRIRKLEKENI